MPQRKRNAKLRCARSSLDCVVMSAIRPEDVAQLHQQIVAYFQQHLTEAEIFPALGMQQLCGKIYASCTVLEERSNDEGTFFNIRGERDDVDGLRAQFSQEQETVSAMHRAVGAGVFSQLVSPCGA